MAEANDLYAESSCFICTGSVSLTQALILAFYKRWLLALNPAADTSVNALLLEASCYNCNSNASMFDLLKLGLLSLIEAA